MALTGLDSSLWLKTLCCYPQNISQLKVLIRLIDKVKLFNIYDLETLTTASGPKLDIVYASLRIMNKVFGNYLEEVVENIFLPVLEDVFPCTDLIAHPLFMEQLRQDTDDFVCQTLHLITTSKFNKYFVQEQFWKHLKKIFNGNFYQDLINKLEYKIEENFQSCHNAEINEMIDEFMSYTESTIMETYLTIKIFLDTVFDDRSDDSDAENKIMASLQNIIDLENLFSESSTEIDIYCETVI